MSDEPIGEPDSPNPDVTDANGVDEALDAAKRAVTTALVEAERTLRNVRKQRDELNKQIKPLRQRVLDLRRVQNGFTPRQSNKKPKQTG